MELMDTSSLPPGFGFHPTDVELVCHYLRRKNLGHKMEFDVIPEVDVYSHEPWDLPAKSQIPTGCCKWYFFTSRGKKYQNGSRSNRATEAGYWKSTGKDRNIHSNKRVVGTKKTLVFYEGRPPYGKRTDWIMHEYYLHENVCKKAPSKDIFVLCRVTKRNGLPEEDEEVLPNQTEKSVIPCDPLPSQNFQKELDSVTVDLTPKKEVSSPVQSVDDLEAWFSELYDPNFVLHLLDESKGEHKVDFGSLTLNHDLEEHFFVNLLEETDISVPEEHSLYENIGCKHNVHEFDSSLFGQSNYGAADTIYTLQFEAEDAANHLNYRRYVDGCVVDDMPTKLPVSSVGLLDNNDKNVPEDGEGRITTFTPSPGHQSTVVDTRIPIQERHGGTFNVIPKCHRIRLQVNKMESRDPGSINQTFLPVIKDNLLDSFWELNQDSVPLLAKTDSKLLGAFIDFEQIRDQVQGNLKSEKPCSALMSEDVRLKSLENTFERSKPEVLSPKAKPEVGSVCASMMATLYHRKLVQYFMPSKFSLEYNTRFAQAYGFLRGVGPPLCKCASAGLNCLLLVGCTIRNAILTSLFMARDVMRFLCSFPASGL